MGFEGFDKGIAFPITSDLSGLKTGLQEAGTELDKTESKFSSFSATLQQHGVAIGAAMTGAGVAIIALADDARKTNATLGTTGIQLGKSTEEMRELALATTNVTFPLENVTATFDLLTRAGMRDTDQLKTTAKAFDTLGDAIGLSAQDVTQIMIPAFNAFDIELEDAGDYTDSFAYLVRNSTIDLQDFSTVMNYLSKDIGTLGLSVDDTVGIMLALQERGIQGSAATRLFRTAVTQAEGDTTKLYEALGITAESVEGYSDKIGEADGYTQKFADAQNKQYGTMDRLKQMYDEFKLSAGSALEPVEGMGAAMAAGGPLILGLTQMPSLLGGVRAGLTLISSHPIILALTLIIAALVVLELKFGILTKAAEVLSAGFGWLSDGISAFVDWVVNAVDWMDVLGFAFKVLLGPIGWVMLAMDALGISWDDVWAGMISVTQGAVSFIAGIIDTMVGGIKWAVNAVIDGVNIMIRGLNLLNFEVPDWVPLIGGQSIGFHLNEIPRMATGGIVTEPTIAMIGEAGPEAVVPLTGSNAGAGATGGDIVFKDCTFTGNEKQIAQQLYTLIERTNRGRGVY